MFATELLREDHQHITRLLRQLDEAIGDAKTPILAKLDQALRTHLRAEDEVFYGAVRDASQAAAPLIVQASTQHRRIEDLLDELVKLDFDDDEYDEKVGSLRERVEEHIRLGETRIFAEAQAAIDDAELERMAVKMRTLGEE